MVIDILEQYFYPFLQACTTLLILLNTQRIPGQNWIEPLESTMRIILAIWRAHQHHKSSSFKILRLYFLRWSCSRWRRSRICNWINSNCSKSPCSDSFSCCSKKFIRPLISHLLIQLIQKKTFKPPLLKKNSPSILLSHSPMILLF